MVAICISPWVKKEKAHKEINRVLQSKRFELDLNLDLRSSRCSHRCTSSDGRENEERMEFQQKWQKTDDRSEGLLHPHSVAQHDQESELREKIEAQRHGRSSLRKIMAWTFSFLLCIYICSV